MGKKNKAGHIALWVVLPVGLVLGFMYLQGVFEPGKIEPGELEAREEEKPKVEKVRLVNVVRTVPLVGTVASRVQGEIQPRVMGEVIEVLVKPGDHVESAQPLIRLKSAELDARVAQAQSAVAQAVSNVTQAEAGILQAEANIRQIRDDLVRYRNLVESGSAPERELEVLQTRLEVAQASKAMAQASRDTAVAARNQAESFLDEARVWLEYATLKAPADGIVGDICVDIGDLVSPGRPVISVYDQSQLYLEAYVPEKLLHTPDMPVTIRIPSRGWSQTGIEPELAASADEVAHSFTVRFALPSTEGLTVGLSGTVSWPLPDCVEEVLVVPESAVSNYGQIETVKVWDGKRSNRRYVRTGERLEEGLVILSGLGRRDEVVVGD